MMPGLCQGTWLRLLRERTEDVLVLRNAIQHQHGEIAEVIASNGQLWGYLSWAEADLNGQYTGKWMMASPGSEYIGSQFLFIGPFTLPFPVRRGRIRLHAFGREVYLWP